MDFTQLIFYVAAGLAVVSSLLMITRKNPVFSAMFLIVALFSIATIFVLLGAHFLAALQVIVYAGAIMVLFLFVIMLLNLGHDFEPDIRGRLGWAFMGGLGLVLFAEILTAVQGAPGDAGGDVLTPWFEAKGVVAGVAEPLFRDYAVAVEITGVLLLVAMVGAVVIARREA
ncbi:MAG: NADH-quinone oxidoreductase subunit J [Gemmatimonadetes bacterium]|uniref:NADH-quinone oxidoreductase subunit J n=1 Tax=Candidatus Kutchimonas denitrificans TaxID=3056748 RepID=A0AAE4Z7H9_9BACT|nr:NADH-quinone oxidoreductase subunit J [Gemmatimonadota bacterium]NIR75215.1 NADH-quinone oxidoreductase subunit J [Candidatus Kutchimonas denitrificans]NIS00153.1 NADH-quinone oxidoreductase subunit J [Gemmatimonadota bacterium]NIT65745.1 NADH-quinone oxidoreductase subunit J [Gemmatimonadota bacterium]NIU53023.1 NADH-quinone oxidoreductase subunit J [Gemmatimonadota bacterium]